MPRNDGQMKDVRGANIDGLFVVYYRRCSSRPISGEDSDMTKGASEQAETASAHCNMYGSA
jgi:hypothetical protein